MALNTKSINDIQADQIVTVTKEAAVLVNGTTAFTVVGGPILIDQICAICVTANDATASTLQFSADGTDGAATTISGASAALTSATAGTIVATVPGTLATAPAVYANGVGITGSISIIVPAGIITTVVGVGSTTGTWKLVMRYRPLVSGIKVY
jgi:hypothetical protein